jgi:phytoene dehydrogenase-like protein
MNTLYDAIIIGAGHNGLATTCALAKAGKRVLCLEKNNYVGGMAGSREILKGCRNDVGATFLFPLAREIRETFEFERYGARFIDLPIMACNLGAHDAPALILFPNPLRQIAHILKNFGPSALLGFIRLMMFARYPAKVMARYTPGNQPQPLEDLLAQAPNEKAREQLRFTFTASAMDLVDRFFPDRKRHRTLRAMMAFAAIQSTYKGPYSPGSALCLIYTLTINEDGGLMRRVEGGIGSLSEALERSIHAHGGEVRKKAAVRRIIVEDGRAVGVELKNGEELRARAVVSNLDKPATFFRLVGREQLESSFCDQIDKIEHRGAYVHLIFKLKRLPKYGPSHAHLNADPHTRFNMALVADPEILQTSYEQCRSGQVPDCPPLALQIPTIMDPSLAPAGFHTATTYGFYFPCEAPKEERGKLRDAMAEKILDRISYFLPDFRDCIEEKAVFSSDHFAAMHGATGGDFTHGLLHPDQMLTNRTVVDGSAHATPIDALFLCGASCHPGPGVTFLPGYDAANEINAWLDTEGEVEAPSFSMPAQKVA